MANTYTKIYIQDVFAVQWPLQPYSETTQRKATSRKALEKFNVE